MVYALLSFFIGLAAGKMFTFPILIAITVISIVLGIYLASTLEELASLITIIFIFSALICNVTMWVTYYVTTNQTWFGTFFGTYVFR
jgi:hypothetical protein